MTYTMILLPNGAYYARKHQHFGDINL